LPATLFFLAGKIPAGKKLAGKRPSGEKTAGKKPAGKVPVTDRADSFPFDFEPNGIPFGSFSFIEPWTT